MALAGGDENGRLRANDGYVMAKTETGLALVGLRYWIGPWTFDGAFDLAYGSVDLKRTLLGMEELSA